MSVSQSISSFKLVKLALSTLFAFCLVAILHSSPSVMSAPGFSEQSSPSADMMGGALDPMGAADLDGYGVAAAGNPYSNYIRMWDGYHFYLSRPQLGLQNKRGQYLKKSVFMKGTICLYFTKTILIR